MFLSSKNFILSKLTDAILPSATFFKFSENESPTLGLLGNYSDEVHVIPLEGENQFKKFEATEKVLQQRSHLLLPNIKFEFNYKSYYQTNSSENIKMGSLVRNGSELQIITKSINESAKPAVTLTNGFEDLGDEKVYFSDWSVYFKDELNWKKIWNAPTLNHNL